MVPPAYAEAQTKKCNKIFRIGCILGYLDQVKYFLLETENSIQLYWAKSKSSVKHELIVNNS